MAAVDKFMKELKDREQALLTELSETREIMNRLSKPPEEAEVPAGAANVLAIGDTPRTAIEALCQTSDKGMPIDWKESTPEEPGMTWALEFTASTRRYYAAGKGIPGGVGLLILKPIDSPYVQ